jgi:probable HAF family extracellular repeat protein
MVSNEEMTMKNTASIGTVGGTSFLRSVFRSARAIGLVVINTLVGLSAVTPARAQVIYNYTLTESGDLPASRQFKAVNDAGQVVGTDYVIIPPSLPPGFGYYPVPSRSSPSIPPPPTPPSASRPSSGEATAINNRGQVAATLTNNDFGSAVRYTDGVGWQNLGAGPGGAANGINNSGQVVGVNSLGHAFRFTDGIGIRDLGVPTGFTRSVGIAINNAGQVAVNATNSQGVTRAFRYTDGVGFQDLGTPAGVASSVAGINSLGQLAVNAGNHGYRYTDGIGLEDLGPSVVTGISAIGVLTGYVTGTGPSEYRDGFGWRNLNSLIPPVPPVGLWPIQMYTAVDISDGGTILGLGAHPVGLTDVFVLTPIGVPEPSALSLLGLAAAGGFAVHCRRRTTRDRRGNAAPAGNARLGLSRLEDRLAPAVVSYTTASGALTFTADPGEADVVSVSAQAANQVQIRVGSGDAIALTGDAVANANFVLSSFAAPNDTLTIATGPGRAPATTFVVNLGDQGDHLDFGLAAIPNGVGSVAIDGQGDTVTITTPVTVGADLSIRSGTINANALINSGGSVTLTSVDTLNLSSSVTAWGDLTLTTDFGIDLAASVSALGNISLRSNLGGNIRQLAGTITANGLAASFGRYGNLTLDQTGNDVNVFAAYLGEGSLRMVDGDNLTVGTVGQTSGITVPDLGASATLITGGLIALTKDVNCENVVLRPAAGGVLQTGGVIKAKALVLLGFGQFVLTQPGNDVVGISADVTGPITYTDVNDLRVRNFSPPYMSQLFYITGITTAGNPVNLTSGGSLVVGGYSPPDTSNYNAVINAGANGAVTLRAAGSVSGGLDVPPPGPFPAVVAATLAVAGGTGIGPLLTQVARVEAQTATGSVDIKNIGDLVVGGVDANFGGIAIGRGAGEIQLVSNGSLALEEGITTAGGTAVIFTAGAITQSPAGTIAAGALSVHTSSGNIVLDQPNRVGILAAENTALGRSISFLAEESLTVGTVNSDYPVPALRGISANNGDVTLRTGGGFTTGDGNNVDPMFNLGTGQFLLTPGQRDPETLSTPSAAHTVAFDAEILASSARIGTPAGEPFSNVFRDTVSVRPSANVAIDVQGNDPTSLPGDALSLITSGGQGPTFIPGPDQASGTLIVPGRQPVTFAGIERSPVESPPQATLTAYAVQTGPQTLTNPGPFVIEVQGWYASAAPGPMFQVVAPDDYPFTMSPALLVPFTAPRLAVADVNGDRLPDLIIAAGSNSAPLVTVVDGAYLFGPQAGQRLRPEDLLAQFVAYDPTFLGGVYVAAGDFNGDGRAEIVTGAGEGGGPHVRTFQYDANATALGNRMRPFEGAIGNFFAYDPAFRGGVRVAVGDVNGDGTPDIVTGAGIGGGPHVKAFSGQNGAVLLSFFAYDAAFRGGVYVAAGDIDGDGRADIVTGAGEGGGPHVKAFSCNDGGELKSFFAYGADFRGGVRVAVGDLNGDGTPDIITGPGNGGGPHVKVFSDVGGPVIGSFLAYDNYVRDGLYVAAGFGG